MANRDVIVLPLLVVPAVLFPGVRLQVALAQADDVALVSEAIHHDSAFVVVSQRPNQEPFPVGTTARVIDIDADGNPPMAWVAGIQRVTLLSYRHQGTRLIGQFRHAAEQEENVPQPLAEEAWALGSELWGAVSASGARAPLPQNVVGLSYWIAAHVPLSVHVRQELLEISSTRARLAKEISLMRTLLDGFRAEHSG
jgi:ATP-dependent Lon protease